VRFLGRTPALPTIPAGDLLANPVKYSAAIRGKIVLVGLTAPGGVNAESGDVVRSPIDQRCPGVELWATSVENILHGEIPRSTATMRLWELFLGMAGSAGIWWLLRRRGPDGAVLAITAVGFLAVLVVQALVDRIATIQSGVDLPVLGLLLGWSGFRVFRPQAAAVPATTMDSPDTVAGQATLPGIVTGAPDASTAPPRSGGMVGRFAIHGELGRGAMGVVLKGKDEGVERIVAIKVLSAGRRLGEHEGHHEMSRSKRLAQGR